MEIRIPNTSFQPTPSSTGIFEREISEDKNERFLRDGGFNGSGLCFEYWLQYFASILPSAVWLDEKEYLFFTDSEDRIVDLCLIGEKSVVLIQAKTSCKLRNKRKIYNRLFQEALALKRKKIFGDRGIYAAVSIMHPFVDDDLGYTHDSESISTLRSRSIPSAMRDLKTYLFDVGFLEEGYSSIVDSRLDEMKKELHFETNPDRLAIVAVMIATTKK